MNASSHAHLLDDELLEYAALHRHLADPVYRIRRYGLMLTDNDLAISFAVGFIAWGGIIALGIGQVGTLWWWRVVDARSNGVPDPARADVMGHLVAAHGSTAS